MTDSLAEATQSIRNIVLGCKLIVESGDKALLAKLHNIMDYYQNDRETIIYGKTVKQIRAEYAKVH